MRLFCDLIARLNQIFCSVFCSLDSGTDASSVVGAGLRVGKDVRVCARFDSFKVSFLFPVTD